MESSILTSTKKVLNIPADYTAFDLDILTHINTAFSVLTQLGIGPTTGYFVEDETLMWEDLMLPQVQLNMVRTYIYLKTRMLFDPPGTSFLIDAMNKQIEEHEWRLNVFREELVAPLTEDPVLIIDGGNV
jgi:hypothetical protein